MCGVAPVQYATRATRVTQSRMACWMHPQMQTVSCDAGGAFSASHTCHPVTCALPALAHTEHPHGEVLYGETLECVDGQRQISPFCLLDGRPKRIPLESASLPPAGGPFFTTDAFVDTTEDFHGVSAWLHRHRLRFGHHLHKHVHSGCCRCHPSFLPSGVLGILHGRARCRRATRSDAFPVR